MRIKIKKLSVVPGGLPARKMEDHIPGGEQEDGKSLPVEHEIEGELAEPIVVGRGVKVFRDKRNGQPAVGLFHTSPVTEVWTYGFATKNSVYQTSNCARFFKVLSDGATKGDIIAFFPGWDKGEMFYIRVNDVSEWCGTRWWLLSEMTPDWVVEMTEAEVFNYCPAAVIPPTQ